MKRKTYTEYKKERQEEFNSLPIKFAFGKEQFKNMMEKWGLTENDTDKIYRFPCGGFYRKADAHIIHDYYSKPDPLYELMNDEKFREEAFRYEMDNHEYAINYYQGDWDVLNCFSQKELEYDDLKGYVEYLEEMGHLDWLDSYVKARKSHMKMAENW